MYAASQFYSYFRNSIKFNLLLRLFLDIIYADNSKDLLVHSTHVCAVSVGYAECVYIVCAFFSQVLTNDVLQISSNAVKMALDMKTKFNTLLHFLHRNVTITHERKRIGGLLPCTHIQTHTHMYIFIFNSDNISIYALKLWPRTQHYDETQICTVVLWWFDSFSGRWFRVSHEFSVLNF